MASSSLEKIGKEGFDLIDQFYGRNKYHQQPYTYHERENPLILEKPAVYSRTIYHPSQDQLIAFRTANPSSFRRVYVYQYSDPFPNSNLGTQDYVGGDYWKRNQPDAVPSKDMDGGEPMTGQTKYSGKWKNWMWG